MNFNEIKKDEYTSNTFGQCIRKRREELHLSIRQLALKVSMSPMYLSDIEKGNRNAPTGLNSKKDYLAALVRELKLGDDEIDAFYQMAAVKNDRYKNIKEYFDQNPKARLAFNTASQIDVPDEEWQKFIDRLNELNPKSTATSS